MGLCTSTNSLPQILIIGLEGSGKTQFLYGDKLGNFQPTVGFNYEEIRLGGIVKVGAWDVSGKYTLKNLWPTFYKNINFSAVVYVIDPDKEDKFPEIRRDIMILTNEEELRSAAFLILFNARKDIEDDLSILCSKIGLDTVHTSLKWKAAILDLIEEDEEFSSCMKWLSSYVSN